MTEIYINLDKIEFDKSIERANEKAISDLGDDGKNNLLYPNLEISGESCEFSKSDELINIYGDLISTDSGKCLGYIDIKTRFDLDLVINLIEIYMKKLGKLKTVLEATK